MNKITSSFTFEYQYSDIKNSDLIAYKIVILEDPWEIFADVRRNSYFYDDNTNDQYSYLLPLTLQGLSTKEDFFFFIEHLSLNNYYEKLKKFDLRQYFLCSKEDLYSLQTQETYWNVFIKDKCLSTNEHFDILFNNDFEELLLIIDREQPVIFSTEKNNFPPCLYFLTSVDIPTSEHEAWYPTSEPLLNKTSCLEPKQEFINNFISVVEQFDLFKPNPPYSPNLIFSNKENIVNSFNNGNVVIPLHFKIKDINLYDIAWNFYKFSLEVTFEENYGYNHISKSTGYYPVEKYYNYYYGNAMASLFLFKLLDLDKQLLININPLSKAIGFLNDDVNLINQFILKNSLENHLPIKNEIKKNKI